MMSVGDCGEEHISCYLSVTRQLLESTWRRLGQGSLGPWGIWTLLEQRLLRLRRQVATGEGLNLSSKGGEREGDGRSQVEGGGKS